MDKDFSQSEGLIWTFPPPTIIKNHSNTVFHIFIYTSVSSDQAFLIGQEAFCLSADPEYNSTGTFNFMCLRGVLVTFSHQIPPVLQ